MITAKRAADCFAYIAMQVIDGEAMTPMRLHKMLYFAQGHCLARYNRPLFGEMFQAWDHGPVVASIYEKSPRDENQNVLPIQIGRDFDIQSIPAEDFQLIMDVFLEYNQFTTTKLRAISHTTDPWKNHYGKANSMIPITEIAGYFRELPQQIGLDTLASHLPVTGYIDNNGILVLPSNWNDTDASV